MGLALFDTSVYIHHLRLGDYTILQTRTLISGTSLWLSAVTLEELYVGADAKGRKLFTRLEKDFDSSGRLLVPNLSDWTKTGNILAQIGEKYGFDKIGKARMTNDALIAVSASRKGITVLTKNVRDFQLISEFCMLQWQIG